VVSAIAAPKVAHAVMLPSSISGSGSCSGAAADVEPAVRNASKSDWRMRRRLLPTRTEASSPRSIHYLDFWVIWMWVGPGWVTGGRL
jgi:hypothetical protein